MSAGRMTSVTSVSTLLNGFGSSAEEIDTWLVIWGKAPSSTVTSIVTMACCPGPRQAMLQVTTWAVIVHVGPPGRELTNVTAVAGGRTSCTTMSWAGRTG